MALQNSNIHLKTNGDSSMYLDPDMLLTEMGFSIEVAISNMLGRGVSRFQCLRHRNKKDGGCVLEFYNEEKTPTTFRPMQISKITSIGYAAQEGIFPKSILPTDLYQNQETGFASEGQHRHGILTKKDKTNAVSIFNFQDFNPHASLSTISFGLADILTGLFNLGIRHVRWQGSLKITQILVHHNLTDEQLLNFLTSPGMDYPIQNKISTLSAT